MPSVAQLEKLLASEPDDVFLNFGLAMALFGERRHAEAVARFDRTLGLDASYIPAYFQKGRALAEAGRSDDARRALDDGIARAREVGDDHAVGEMTEFRDMLA